MSLRPGPVTDPFFARVRRRHPEADLVLLPPEGPDTGRSATAEPGAEEALAADRLAVEQAARERGIDEPSVLARGTRPGTVRARVRVVREELTAGERVVELHGPDRPVGAARVRHLLEGR